MNFSAKLNHAAVTAVSVAILVGASFAQTAAPKSFEVATIRSASLPTPESFRGGQFRAGTTIDAGRADFEFVTLADLLPYAYRVKSFQVSGPSSLRETRWNIVAKLPAGATQDQVPDMVQALLVDRFHLTVHHEKREQPVYELTVAKGGPKLAAAAPGDSGSDASTAALPGLGGPFPFGGGRGPGGRGPGDGPPGGDGRGGRGFAFGNGNVQISPNESDCGINLEFKKLTMSSLADTLTPFLDRPVLDSTGLKGTYQASIKLPMEVMFAMMQNQIRNNNLPPPPGGFDGRGGPGGFDGGGRGGRGPGNCDPGAAFNSNSSDTSSAALFQAVQQLGLKLQAKKAPFDTIVVDHVDKAPSDN